MKKYQNDWSIRIYEHLLHLGRAVFVTLTYREKVVKRDYLNKYPYESENLPLPPIQCVPRMIDTKTGEIYRSVYKKHVQGTLKRFREFRRRQGLSTSFSYFITAEYGPRTLRPHYHAIFFGLTKYELRQFIADWEYRFGHVQADDIKFGPRSHFTVGCYVGKYCSKGVFENPLVKKKKVFKCFKLISKKLGYSYVERMYNYHRLLDLSPCLVDTKRISRIVDRCFYSLILPSKDGESTIILNYGLPKYYKEHIFGSKNLLRYKMLQEVYRRNDDLYREQLRQVQSERNCSDIQAVHYLGLQNLRDLVYKEKELHGKMAKYYDKSKL